jgi:hypothetical protein
MRAFAVLLLSVLFFGCKKDPIYTLEGKWNLVKVSYKEFQNGTHLSNEWDVTGETIEFRPDGQVEVIDQSGSRIAPYTISGETVSYLSMTYQILDLEENSVTLLDHHVHATEEYHDTYLHLKR